MMQLLCNGEAVDLAQDTRIQFVENNPLFAFDKLSCERTTEFDLPATPTNDKIFALARRPDFSGQAMRVRFTSVLRIGIAEKSGYLYVSQWTGNVYKAVFVCGAFLALQHIRELGKLPEIVNLSETVLAGMNTIRAGEDTEDVLFANVTYMFRQPTGDYEKEHPAFVRPSLGVKPLLQRICQQNGIAMPTIPTAARLLRIIPPRAYLPHGEFKLQCRLGQTYAPTPIPTAAINSLPQYPSSLLTTDTADYSVIWQDDVTQITPQTFYRVVQFKCLNDVDITIPRDFPETAYMYDMSGERSHNIGDEWGDFYGERMFTKAENSDSIVRTGYSLAGRTISLQAGDVFSFVDERMYVNTLVNNIQTKGFILHTNTYFNTLYTLSIASQNDGDAARGQIVRAQDCLPDVSVVDLLKTIAAVSGTVLNMDGNNIVFEPLVLGSFNSRDIASKVIERGTVSRGFMQYAQHNYVRFDSGENVKDKEKAVYDIQNVNLNETNDLQVIPFSEGDDASFLGLIQPWLIEEPAAGVLYVTGFDDKYILANNGKYYEEPDPEEDYDGGWVDHYALTRATIAKNSGVQQLCTKSTQVDVRIKMAAFEFEQVTAKTKLRLDGMQYVWTSKQWQDGVARFVLAQC